MTSRRSVTTLAIAWCASVAVMLAHGRTQLAVLTLVIVLTGLRGMAFHGVANMSVAGWDALVALFLRIGDAIGIGANQAANFGTYVVVPGVLLLALGARLQALGCARFAPGTTPSERNSRPVA